MPFAAIWMDLEIIILSEVSQKEKDKYHMISLTCGIKNRTQMNPSTNRNRLTNIENRLVVAKGEGGGGGGMDWELGGWEMQTIISRMDKQQGPTV